MTARRSARPTGGVGKVILVSNPSGDSPLHSSEAHSDEARCRMHGGARGSGAPIGNQNARKHGMYTKVALEERQMVRRLIREMEERLQEIEDR